MGDASPAVSYDVDVVEEADFGSESPGGDTKGSGNDSLGFSVLGATVGAMGLNEGGGGRASPTRGGEDAIRDDGRDEERLKAGLAETVDGPAACAPDGVIGRDATNGGASAGAVGWATLPDGGAAAESKAPNRASRSLIAPVGEVDFAPERAEDWLAALNGRGGGANGGGASGGGAKGGGITADSRPALTNFSKASVDESSSASSLALGTMSDRNSRSSDDNARVLRLFPGPRLLRRESRFRKRDTADGAGGVSGRLEVGSGADA